MSTNAKLLSIGRYVILLGRKSTQKEKIPLTLPLHKDHIIDTKKLTIEHKETPSEKLIDITMGAQDILATATTIFPFVLFPDTINIDRQKITLVRRSFFRTAEIISVQISDVINVDANIGPLFGSIKLTSKYFLDNTHSINYLGRKDVTKVQRLLQGFIIAHRQKIDCSSIDNDQLITLLTDLGQGSSN